jgi:hypothetical protein
MDITSTEHFNNRHEKVFNAALALQDLNKIFTAHSETEIKWIARRNVAMQAAWRSLFRDYPNSDL